MKNKLKAKAISKKESMLAILAQERMKNAIDAALVSRRDYQGALKEYDKVYEQMEKMGLSPCQREAIENVISAANFCGAINSKVAYRLGMQDGIKLATELQEIADGKA